MIVLFLATVALVSLVAWLIERKRHFTKIGLYSPPGAQYLWGHLRSAMSGGDDVLPNQLRRMVRDGGDRDTIGIYMGGTPHILTSNADIIRDVFFTKFDKFHKRWHLPLNMPSGRPGVDLFNSHGQTWKRLRSIIDQVFLTKNIRKLFPLMRDRCSALADHMGEANGEPFECYPLFNNFTLDVIVKALLSDEKDYQVETKNVFSDTFDVWFTSDKILRQFALMFPELDKYLWWISMKLRSGTKLTMFRVLHQTIEARVAGDEGKTDIIQFMTNSIYDGHENSGSVTKYLSKAEVLTNAVSLLFAGSDTQSGALATALVLLARDDGEFTRDVQTEIDQLWSGEIDELTFEMVQKMTHVEAVVKEGLRLFPMASGVVNRECSETCVVGKGATAVTVLKGMNVACDVHAVHYNKEIWGQDAHKFRPARWLSPDQLPSNLSISFMPFGAGRRICPGQRQAMVQMKCALAVILKRFNLAACDRTPTTIRKVGNGAPYPENSYVVMVKRDCKLSKLDSD